MNPDCCSDVFALIEAGSLDQAAQSRPAAVASVADLCSRCGFAYVLAPSVSWADRSSQLGHFLPQDLVNCLLRPH